MKIPSDGCSSDLDHMAAEEYWIGDFMHRKENYGIIRVPDEFLEDRFNLVGLERRIFNLEDAYNSILDRGPRGDFLEESCLYYLIHQRYIFTKPGLEAVLDRVMNKEYGVCPRVGCKASAVIPIGMSDFPGKKATKVYCHSCTAVYEPGSKLRMLDGCAWGRSFPHFLILTYPYHFPSSTGKEYIPRIYGIRICKHDDNDSHSEDN
ncbi:subunit beta of casein kinase II [Ordospora colligata]|uniref:Casein kinase II subunit beta n=1 Tax=Ordospora colligata OC4 TaxID=1354746 RepID=A0A0B2UF73_9MICR|nr:subunit beta of casein kinase II [Ordospora colligata OC4]KHN69706.1 subunit beta of casein kinase II [Ordospora colligata OC4]TBU15825.1 subunit beta of casein kinase II [Ordospora colligata]TBU15953.1 subunit beta of casein kinase II [Ordospora colligata]TBU18847.1 subunit beta of casein kinase II [Ordospora colligata]